MLYNKLYNMSITSRKFEASFANDEIGGLQQTHKWSLGLTGLTKSTRYRLFWTVPVCNLNLSKKETT